MIEGFDNFMKNLGLSENTCKSYIYDLEQYEKYYFDSYKENLDTLIRNDVLMYKSYLKNNLDRKPKTINRALSALKTYNKFLIELKKQDNTIIKKEDYMKIQQNYNREDVPEDREINLLHAAAFNKRDYCVLIIAIYSGLREEEIVELKISHINFKRRCLEIYGKGDKYRTVTMNDIMKNAIEDYLEERLKDNRENEYLFIGKKSAFYGNKPMGRKFINRTVEKYMLKAGLQGIHPHILRAYYCTHAYETGYTLLQIAAEAGHSSINTTRGYIGKDKKDLLKLANSL